MNASPNEVQLILDAINDVRRDVSLVDQKVDEVKGDVAAMDKRVNGRIRKLEVAEIERVAVEAERETAHADRVAPIKVAMNRFVLPLAVVMAGLILASILHLSS